VALFDHCVGVIDKFTVLYCLYFCRCRRTGRDYWFGLYKQRAKPGSSAYWLDGSTSLYRKSPFFNEHTYCVRLKCQRNGAFEDRPCGRKFRYLCKKVAGTSQSDVTKMYFHTLYIANMLSADAVITR